MGVARTADMTQLLALVMMGLIGGGGGVAVGDREGRASLRSLAEAAFNAISNTIFEERQDSTTQESTSESSVASTSSPADAVMECQPDFFQVGDSCFYVSRNLM